MMIFILFVVTLFCFSGEDKPEIVIKTVEDYYNEMTEMGVSSKEDSIRIWNLAISNVKHDSLTRVRDALWDNEPEREELSRVIRITKTPVLRYLNDRKAIVLEFPDRWDWLNYIYERTATINKTKEVIEHYKIRYQLDYLHNGIDMETNIRANVSHNTSTGEWQIKRFEITEFDQYYIQTAEGRERLKRALTRGLK